MTFVAASPTRSGVSSVSCISLTLLNTFELRCDDAVVQLPPGVQRLLAFLALHEHPLHRLYVAGALWTDSGDERALASLRSTLWRLNRHGHGFIDATTTHLSLSHDVDVDVRRGFARAKALVANDAGRVDQDPNDATLDGQLLPDWYEDWVIFERERFRQLGLHALEALAERLLDEGRLLEALSAALAAVRGEPLRESAHRILIRVHLAEGNVGEARRQYELCAGLLRERLGLGPSQRLVDLVHAVES